MNTLAKDANPIGEILIRRGKLRRFQLEFLLNLQRNYAKNGRKIRFGDLLLEHQLLETKQIDDVLVIQKELPDESITQIVNMMNKEVCDELSTVTQILNVGA
jgi:hypothetical protein